MTVETTHEFAPLVIRRARPASVSNEFRADPVDVTGDTLPYAVQRRADGTVVSRQSTLTEVHQETTDDN